LAAAVLSQTSRFDVLFGNEFFRQNIQDFEVALDLNYTIFDFGARSGRINAARAQVLAANFAFNDTHRNVISSRSSLLPPVEFDGQRRRREQVSPTRGCRTSCRRSLGHGLATLPDVLEARSATAQAEYDLQAVLGAEEIARGDLATAVGVSATATIPVQPLNQVTTPDSIGDTVDQAIDRHSQNVPI